jgi:hypothetical protein
MDTTTRALVFIACVALLALYVGWRWWRAGRYLEAREQFQQRGRENFLALKQHPLTDRMWGLMSQRHRVSWEPPQDPDGYQLVWLALVDDRATCYRVEHADRATMLVAYLQRQRAPEQLQVSMSLATGELHENVPPYGWVLQAPE